MTETNKCYNCGKVIPERDLILKEVSTGMYSSVRKPFHSGCWKIYRSTKIKKDLIEYATLADGVFLMLGGVLAYSFHNVASFAILGSTIAVAIGLGYSWFKIEK